MRLIDADALVEKKWDVPFETKDAHFVQVIDVGDVEEAPTIDPETLRPTGKWSFGEILDIDWYSNVPAWFCSNCGSHIVDKSRKPRVPNMKYCHNCGCKMENVQ